MIEYTNSDIVPNTLSVTTLQLSSIILEGRVTILISKIKREIVD